MTGKAFDVLYSRFHLSLEDVSLLAMIRQVSPIREILVLML